MPFSLVKLRFDEVDVKSGQSYERKWIESGVAQEKRLRHLSTKISAQCTHIDRSQVLK